MNRDRLFAVADAIEKSPARFDMGAVLRGDGIFTSLSPGTLVKPKCGTVGCVAGFTCALFAPKISPVEIEEFARLILSLDKNQADRPFYIGLERNGKKSIWRENAGRFGIPENPDYGDITADIAVTVLRALAKGKISF